MANPTSYLQTLPEDEAIAFVASLQKVRDHLQEELEWMNQQVQQKTIQLQGIDTLLAEAAAPKSKSNSSGSASDDLPAKAESSTLEPLDPAETEDVLERVALSNGDASSVAQISNVDPTSSPIAPLGSPKSLRDARTVTGKPKAAKAPKQPRSAAKANSQSSSSSRNNQDLRKLLVKKFQGKNLTDAVAQILKGADKPLHLDDLLMEMYGKLSESDFKRAKVSLANVLSVGKKDGKWQNLGEGLYAANANT